MIHPERRRENLKKIEEMDNYDAEPQQPVWMSACINKKVDIVEVVRCKDCKYAHLTYDGYCKYCDNIKDDDGFPIERYHPGDWFCADGEPKDRL